MGLWFGVARGVRDFVPKNIVQDGKSASFVMPAEAQINGATLMNRGPRAWLD